MPIADFGLRIADCGLKRRGGFAVAELELGVTKENVRGKRRPFGALDGRLE